MQQRLKSAPGATGQGSLRPSFLVFDSHDGLTSRNGSERTLAALRQLLSTLDAGAPGIEMLTKSGACRCLAYVRIAILMAPPLPVSVAQVAEALWMQASEEGRRRALSEQRMTDSALVTGMLKKGASDSRRCGSSPLYS
jgi:hypothetical protein